MSASADLPGTLLGLARDDEFDSEVAATPVPGVADSILGFHAQQAVEKAMKAALAAEGAEFPHTHDLDGLLELCGNSGLEIPAALEGVDRLAPYGVHMRYGTSHGQALDRGQALLWAAAAIEWAQGVIESRGAY